MEPHQCVACVGSLVKSKLSGRFGMIIKIEDFINYKHSAEIKQSKIKFKTVTAYFVHWFDQASNIIAKISSGWLYRVEFEIISQ